MPVSQRQTKAALTVLYWGGQIINDGVVYTAKFLQTAGDNGASPRAQSITNTVPGQYPLWVRGQPQDRMFQLTIEMPQSFTQAQLELLQSWFDPKLGSQFLYVQAPDGVQRRLLAFPESFVPRTVLGNAVLISLRAMGPWEAVTAGSSSAHITTSGQSVTLNNPGTTRVYPTLVITPNTLKTHASAQVRRRRALVANLSELPVSDPIGDGWPVDIASAGLNTSALNGGGHLLASMFDLGVYLNGALINRWPSPASVSATSKVWTNLQLQARKTATLAANITSGSTSLSANNSSLFAGWPSSGFFIIGSECIQYTSRTLSTLSGLVRGARNTTAASHTAAALLYWVEHPFMDLLYDYTAAADPAPPDDRKPAIALASSTNASFVWDSTGVFFNFGTRRSAAWQKMYTDEGNSSLYVGVYDSGAGGAYFNDVQPTIGKPNFNNIYLDNPYTCAVVNATLGQSLFTSRATVYGVDLSGNEYLLGDYGPSDSGFTVAPAAARIRIQGRHALLTGDILFPTDLNQNIIVGALSSFSFICDRDEANVIGLIVRARNSAGGGTANLVVNIWNDQGGVPSEALGIGQTVAFGGSAVYTNYLVLPTLFNGSYIRLQSGQRYHVTFQITGGTGTPQVSGHVRSRARQYYVDQMNIQQQLTACCGILTDSLSQAQEDSTFKTNNLLYVSNVTVSNDTSRNPYLSLSPEEDCYLLSCRITNTLTTDYMDLYFPMVIGQSVTIDCENKRVVDSETGLDIPFAASPSNDGEWLPCIPGDNVFTYTEAGVVDTTLAWTVRGNWL